MKIVKFENGKYGIRKWSLAFLGWVYLSSTTDAWFSNENRVNYCQFGSLEYAEERLNRYLNPPKLDVGVPVVKKTRVPPLGASAGRCTCRH